MKFMKYLLAFALAVGFSATASVSHAQGTVSYIGTGSSALFLELGQAAAGLSDTGCYWTQKSNAAIAARDDRPTIPAGETDENGSIWIAWGPGPVGSGGTCAAPVAPFDVYSQMSLDSVLGDRCFFMVNSAGAGGCLQVITIAAGTAGVSPSLLGAGFTDTAIPAAVISTLNGQRIFVAATDIRPEDAKFASARMFTACGSPIVRNPYINTSYQTSGLGYQTSTTGVGTPIQSFTNPGVVFHVHDFNISGNDPISGQPLGARATYTVNTVGAQPEVVVVSPAPAGGTGLSAASDINFSTLAEYLIGGYGRSNDLTGNSTANPVTTLIREPLSGTYNVMEYSVPNSNEFKTSQEVGNCSGAVVNSNPLHVATANGKVAGAVRERAIGTGEVTAALQAATTDTLGYFFWSAGNASNFTPTNGKYLTVNGVDPILDDYNSNPVAPGVLPTGANLSAVTFSNLNKGDYAIWSALRLVSLSPEPAGVAALISGVQTLSSTKPDFIPLSNLKIWKSHFNLFAIGVTNNSNGHTVNPATPGDLCSLAASAPEGGGDAGAMTISVHGNNDFCTDFNTPIGINDKNN
jgi:hypothetical protein